MADLHQSIHFSLPDLSFVMHWRPQIPSEKRETQLGGEPWEWKGVKPTLLFSHLLSRLGKLSELALDRHLWGGSQDARAKQTQIR